MLIYAKMLVNLKNIMLGKINQTHSIKFYLYGILEQKQITYRSKEIQ